MTKYNVFYNNGEREIFIKTIDDRKVDVDATIKELNKDVSEDDSIHGYGYYVQKTNVDIRENS